MKSRILNHPFITGIVAFLLIFLGGSVAGIILGMFVMATSGPNGAHGGAMAAGMIWSLAFTATLIAGIVLGFVTTVALKQQKP